MIRVILLIDCASEHDRKLLRGMMRYSKENGPWLFYRLSPDFRFGEGREEWALQWARQWKADAIIGRWDDSKMHLLDKLEVPVVLQNNKSRSDVFSNLTGDYDNTGKMAAEYFRKKLYTEYAFFGIKDIVWSEERCEGYRREVEKNNGHFYSYMEPITGDDREMIKEWLEKLPKPVALFCCDDAHALFITETCKIAGIRVPEDIAILGVDDDDLLCSISDPTISSIQMDVENGGYMTCKLLHQQLMSRDKRPFNVSISPLGIKERSSTSALNIVDPHVLKLVRTIDNSYSQELKMEELLQAVPLSRRSIEMRFKKATGYTIYQYLLSVRVDHFAYLITTTDRSYVDIAYEVGFRDLTNVSRTFRKYKGCSPLEYRRRYCVM
jgi:LacI family transcriptional regulator